jgi:hypothetical protein
MSLRVTQQPLVQSVCTSKLGEEPESCEDALRVSSGGELRIALSDGASTASFSAEWANRLADWYVARSQHPNGDSLIRMAPILGKAWRRSVTSRPLPWHAEEKMQGGSFATLLGVSVIDSHWRAIAVGDTCLFHIRGDSVLASFPYTTSEEFGARPVLVWTGPSTPAFTGAIQEAEGQLQPADLLVAATDGFAQWLVASVERNQQPWEIFKEGPAAIQTLVDEERAARRMRNDDVACAWLTL